MTDGDRWLRRRTRMRRERPCPLSSVTTPDDADVIVVNALEGDPAEAVRLSNTGVQFVSDTPKLLLGTSSV
jgi:hypothetical protein